MADLRGICYGKSSIFCDVMQRRLVASHRGSGDTHRPTFKNQAVREFILLGYGPHRLYRNVCDYQYTLCNITEERISYLHRGGDLKSHIPLWLLWKCDDENQISLKLGNIIRHFTWISKYVLQLPAILDRNTYSLLERNGIRLKGQLRRKTHYSNVPQCCIIRALYVHYLSALQLI